MVELPPNTLVPAGVILAALIAGVFSFITLVLSKEQKVSEFRQNWSDGLRKDVGLYVGNLFAIAEIYVVLNDETESLDTVARTKETVELHTAVSAAYTRILLRLNPSDKNETSRGLREALLETRELSAQGEWEQATKKADNVRIHAQLVLKEEWERVKRGEAVFVWSKRVAVTGFAVAIALAVKFL